MASKGGGSKQIVGYRYDMAFHAGISRGPTNELCEIRVADLEVWQGSVTSTGEGTINAPEAFGGDEKEGGIKGTFKLFMGDATQVVDDFIKEKLGGDVPDWRGVCTLVYYGQIGSNNPYPKPWKFRVRRSTAGWDDDNPWYPERAVITLSADAVVTLTFIDQPKDEEYLIINGINAYFRTTAVGTYDIVIGGTIEETVTNLANMINFYSVALDTIAVASGNVIELRGASGTAPVAETPYGWATNVAAGGDIHAMNGAHIVYECVTNRVWGRGLPRAMMDDVAFRAAADKLYAENFGLCFLWNRQDDIDQFVQNVIDHIGAALYIDRQTGLLKLRLIRNDYDPAALTAYTFENGILDITEDQASTRDTMANEIIVEYNDPAVNKLGSVRVQNLASFQSIGSFVSLTVQYHGIATATMALRIAQRDLEFHSSQLRRLTLKMNRSAWRIAPADVIKVHVPSRGIDNMLLRVGEIEESALTEPEVTLKCVQDVFGLPDTTIVDPQPGQWLPPDRSARVITDRELTEMTYFDLADNLPQSQLPDFSADDGWIKMYAKQPSGASISYDLQSRAGGELVYVTRTNAGFDANAVLVGDIGYYDTDLTITGGDKLAQVSLGALVRIGDEYMRLDAIDISAGTITVARGVADTIPQPHFDKARIWFQTAFPTGDYRDYASGEIVGVRLLSRTTSQVLDPAFAYEDFITMGSRQGRPYPPGNLKVNGTGFGYGPFVVSTGDDIIITWAHRDRIGQSNTLLEHEAGSTGPEVGVTYNVKAYAADGTTLLNTDSGITGTSVDYIVGNPSRPLAQPAIWYWVEAVRDGIPSLQHYWVLVSRPYTFDDGFDYDFDGHV